jgi:hypothetical protein
MRDLSHDLTRLGMALRRRLLQHSPRRFQCYCIGAAKTGTTSVASVFSMYRTQHEPEVRRTNSLVIDYLEGRLGDGELRDRLIERDRRLNLELESAHPLGYLAEALVEIFPAATFIVTVREPLDWLHSRLNFHHKVHPRAWAEYRKYFWIRRHTGYAPEERILERYDLCSLDTYLSQYADHYERVLSAVPEERRLVVRTSRINDDIQTIAAFIGASPGNVAEAHSNRSDDKIKPLDEIDDRFVRERILHHCGSLIERFFPERLSFYQELSRDGAAGLRIGLAGARQAWQKPIHLRPEASSGPWNRAP